MAFSDYVSRSEAAGDVPIQLVDELIAAVKTGSIVMQLGREVPVTTRDSRVPVVTRLPSASWITGTDPDTGLKSVSDMAISNTQLLAEELATIAVLPQNVIDDSGFPIWDAVKPELASAIARAYDEAVMFGTNKPTTFPPAMVTAATTANQVVSADVYANATDNPALVLQAAGMIAQVGVNADGAAVAPGWEYRAGALRTSALVANPVGASSPFPMVLGGLGIRTRPDTWPAPATNGTDAVVANWKNVLVGMRKQITMEMFDTGVISDASGVVTQNLLQQDLIAVRVTFRAGYLLATPANHYSAAPCPVAIVKNSGTVFTPHLTEASGKQESGKR